MRYHRERGYDCSIDENISALLPSAWLVRTMKLRWSRKGFSYVDARGRKVAFDPSEYERGPSALLIDRKALTEFLKEIKCDLIWTILGAKVVAGSTLRSSRERYEGRTILQAVYRLHNGKLTGGPLRRHVEM